MHGLGIESNNEAEGKRPQRNVAKRVEYKVESCGISSDEEDPYIESARFKAEIKYKKHIAEEDLY